MENVIGRMEGVMLFDIDRLRLKANTVIDGDDAELDARERLIGRRYFR